jgi:tetratricopeptide (TPR) repeat protein
MASPTELCPEDVITKAAEAAAKDSRRGLARIDDLLRTYPDDPRLHFLKGSLLAALQRYDEAVAPMAEAVEIAPGFHIARFQLGLLHLSSGAPEAAGEVWKPLSGLAPTDPLRLFAEGLQHMARDQFGEAEKLLREGIALNQEHPAVNGDMQKVLDQLTSEPAPPSEGSTSEAHWLLELSNSRTKH